jgi:hypothetical protein
MEIRRQGALMAGMNHDPHQAIEAERHEAWPMRPAIVRMTAIFTLCLATACAGPRHSPAAQELSAAVGRTDTGVTAGPTGGAPIGGGAHFGLDDQERHRLLDATRVAFAATTDETTSYTVVPQNIDAEPTGVTATPAGPRETRADGSICRPIRLSVTKQERTTIGTLTFCQAPGSRDLKLAPSI